MKYLVGLVALSLLALPRSRGRLPAQAGHPVLAIGIVGAGFFAAGSGWQDLFSSKNFADSPILMVIFICNHCPTSQLYEGRMKKLVEDYAARAWRRSRSSRTIPSAILLSELGYTDVSDSLEEMKIRAEYRHFDFPYLYDGETQSVSQAYGPVATPHVFIFDKDRKLRYEGRIDDAQRESIVKKQDARAALDAMVAGKPVPVPHTPAFGCSTKWKSKIDFAASRR